MEFFLQNEKKIGLSGYIRIKKCKKRTIKSKNCEFHSTNWHNDIDQHIKCMQNLIIKFYNICIIPLDRLENWSDWLSAILFETWFGAAKQLSQVLVGCGVAAPPYCFLLWFWGEGRSEEWCGEGWREGCRGEG